MSLHRVADELNLEAGVSARAFSATGSDGSPQQLHFFADEAALDSYRRTHPVDDDRDHSFILPGADRFSVVWVNRAGPIQLCGSAAYALGWLLTQLPPVGTEVTLASEGTSLLFRGGNARQLALPARYATTEHSSQWRGLAVCDGVFLIELNSLSQLTAEDCHARLMDLLSERDVHALCACYWDSPNGVGYLRYFVPRYGRPEDWVTGSIHSLLGPWMLQRYGVSTQHWQQLSASPGCVTTRVTTEAVWLSGPCELDAGTEQRDLRAALLAWLAGSAFGR